jgi:thiol-disulfide isomerase/thioredoxin
VVNARRLLIAVPVLVALAVAVFLLVDREDATATTPKAVLLETEAPAAGSDVGVRQGQVARDFSAALPDGTDVRLSELRGTPVIVNFWATWCTSCLAEMPDLKAVQDEFGAEQVEVLAVNSGESFGDAGEFMRWLDAPDFLFAFDPSLAVTDAYGVVGLSHTVFVDADGVITSTYTGQLTADLMREYTRDAIASTISAEAPFKLRLPGTVEARNSTLVVEETAAGEVRISGRRLRCDDTFCAAPAVDALREQGAIIDLTSTLEADPPSVLVEFDAVSIDARGVGEALAALVDGLEDPLYQHPIVVEVE